MEKLKESLNINYLCSNCSNFKVECFSCKKLASFIPKKEEDEEKMNLFVESKRTRSALKKFTEAPYQNNTATSEVVKCSIFNCPKYYHFACA